MIENIILIRHGQSKGNVDKQEYYKNKDCDIELTDLGRFQAGRAARDLFEMIYTKLNVDGNEIVLYHSNYKRAIDTANIIYDYLHSVKYFANNFYTYKFEDSRLREREWGNLRDVVDAGDYEDDVFDYHHRPHEGESFHDVEQRVKEFHSEMERLNLIYLVNTVVIVAHGEFNKVYIKHLLGWSDEEFLKWSNQDNCELIHIHNGKLSEDTPMRISKYYKGN